MPALASSSTPSNPVKLRRKGYLVDARRRRRSDSEEGSYLRLIDLCILNSRLESTKKKKVELERVLAEQAAVVSRPLNTLHPTPSTLNPKP